VRSAATESRGGASTLPSDGATRADQSSLSRLRNRVSAALGAAPDSLPPAPDDSAPLGKQLLRVAIADDHRLMLDGIKRALETAPDIRVVGEAITGEGLVALVPRVRPDVVILDMRMPNGDGLATLQALQKSHPNLKVIMLSVFDDPETIEKAFGHGAAGYVVKSINPLDLPSTIRSVFEGTVCQPGGRARSTGTAVHAPQATLDGLTNRELTILKLVAEGLPNLDIASRLFVTEQTIKFHLSNIYRKLEVANRTEAARYVYKCGLVEETRDGASRATSRRACGLVESTTKAMPRTSHAASRMPAQAFARGTLGRARAAAGAAPSRRRIP
jgi:DNA-binding NarL/FixJ family response regulator